MKRHELTDLRDAIKRASQNLGGDARHLLLAYAMLRGLPYRRCEALTVYDRPELPEAAREFFRKSLAHGVAQASAGRVDKAAALAWILVPEETAAADARRAREQSANAANQARRAAYRAQVLASRGMT